MNTYFILKFLLVITLFSSGYLLSKRFATNSDIKVYYYPYLFAIFPVLLAYTFVEGLRYGRAADYFSYKFAFTGKLDFNFEPLFQIFCEFLSFSGAPYYTGFLICSFFLIFSGTQLTKEFRFASLFLLPLFYLDTIVQSSNLVRMYVAISFQFLAYKFMMKKENIKSILLFVLAGISHYSVIFSFPFIFLFYKLKNPFVNVYLILILFLLAQLFPIGAEVIVNYLFLIEDFSAYSSYIENSDYWILGEGVESQNIVFSIFYYIRLYFVPIYIIWYGYPLIKKYSIFNFHLFYHMYVFAVLILPTALALPTELLTRMVLFFISLKFIVLGLILYNFFKNFYTKNLLTRVITLIIILDIAYSFLKSIFIYNSKLGNLFVWDNLLG